MKTARGIVQSVAGYKLAHAFYKLNSDPFLNSDHMSEWKQLVYAGNRLTFSARCLCSRKSEVLIMNVYFTLLLCVPTNICECIS